MFLHNLGNQLTQQGHEVHVLAPKLKGAHEHDMYYRVHRYGQPSSKRYLVRQTLPWLFWLHWRFRFDILHCHAGYPQAYVGAVFKKWAGIPMVVRPHGSDIVPEGRIRRHPRLEKRLREGLTAADAIVAQGRYLKESIVALGVDKDRVSIIHNGVDLKSFARAEPFPHPRPYILAVGSLIRRKGFDLLLEAYKKLKVPCPDLLIAGTGREMDQLKSLAGDLLLADRVRFLGFIDGPKKVSLYRSAQFLVCPSRKEPFANVILEAMAANLPVVASDVDGSPEMVRHGENGLLFPCEDVAALAGVLQDLIDNQAFLDRLRSGVAPFVSQFDWPCIAARYLVLYRRLHEEATLAVARQRSGH